MDLIAAMYIVLGINGRNVDDVTIPVVYSLIKKLKHDGIWFGVVYVKLCQLGMIFPSIAINLLWSRDRPGRMVRLWMLSRVSGRLYSRLYFWK
jgi:TRAP-type C4-dicarboxylate transport system permease large subunit